MRSRILLVLAAAWVSRSGAAVNVKVTPPLGGYFRPGYPVLLRVTLENEGPAVRGSLDVVVEGLTYRRPVRIGAGTAAAVDVLAAVHSDGARARVVVRSSGGELLADAVVGLGLRRRTSQAPVVIAVGAEKGRTERLFAGSCAVSVVRAEELPTSAGGYFSAHAVVLLGDGGGVPSGARAALVDWVSGGGMAVFVLAPDAPVQTEGLLAELGGCSGRPSAGEWLRAVAELRQTRVVGRGRGWRHGLGDVVAGTVEDLDAQELSGLMAMPSEGDVGVDADVYEAFREASLGRGVRWRLVGGALGLLAAGLVVALLARRGWRPALAAACVIGVAAALSVVAWGGMLPPGRGVLETAGIVERVSNVFPQAHVTRATT